MEMKKNIDNKQLKASDILKQKREDLILEFVNGTESDLLRRNSKILDDYFLDIFQNSKIGPGLNFHKNPFSIIALGGYGREEQCIHSDVDVLLLFKKKVPMQAEELVREIIYPLWDCGFDVGHGTRSVKECLSLAGSDIEVFTSLLDGRFICGESALFLELKNSLRDKVINKKGRKLINWLTESNNKRHELFGDSTYLLEPNLKEGQGGLRDYHSILWMARVLYDSKNLSDLEETGHLSRDEFKEFSQALDFIINIRNHLHLKSGRKSDQLNFEFQIKLANSFNYTKVNGFEPVEMFLGDLHGKMDCIKQKYQMFLHEIKPTSSIYSIKYKRTKKPKTQDIIVKKDMLYFSSSEAIVNTPDLLISIFYESARLKLPLSADTKRLFKNFLYLIDDKFISSSSCKIIFERILEMPAPIFNVLKCMLSVGFLTKYIPEFKDLLNRVQYDEYHLYPVDKHSLYTVQTMKKFGTSNDPTGDKLCGDVYKNLKKRKLLLWAALFHDIGKGVEGENHSEKGSEIVKIILSRMNYRQDSIDIVSFLVKEHLSLIKVATRRDIDDENTAIMFARIVKDPNLLQMLFLLTVADSIATGPNAWNSWTSSLVKNFFLKVLNILEKGELASNEAVNMVESKKGFLLNSTKKKNEKEIISTYLEFMSSRYMLTITEKDILKHIKLHKELNNQDSAWLIEKNGKEGTRTVTICAKDQPGLFSKIAGVFTLNNMNIIGAQIFTWRNNIAMDIFKVQAPLDTIYEDRIWTKAEKQLNSVISKKLDLQMEIDGKISSFNKKKPLGKKKLRINFDNDSSSFFSIIEVISYDYPGLLFEITNALYKLELNIWVSKIATKADQVVDVFYVRNLYGQKIDSLENIEFIKKTIKNALTKNVNDELD